MRILTIHGVGRPENWQSRVETILGKYFECIPVNYPQYRSRSSFLAVLKVVIEPWALAGAAVALLALYMFNIAVGSPLERTRWHGLSLMTLIEWLILAVGVGAGLWLAFTRRERAFAEARSQIERATTGGVSTHVIAHSLGTYLTCRALREVSGLKLKRVVYVGSVVKRRFQWDALTGRRLEALRNEVGGKDLVVVLAGFARWLFFVSDLGWAGWRGFRGPSSAIHDCPESDIPCPTCTISAVPAAIHNTRCPYDKHNTLFLSAFHAARFWLPFLWGYDPAYFLAFLDRCQKLDRTRLGQADFVEELNRLRYASPGASFCFEELVVRELRAKLRMSADQTPDANTITNVVTKAWYLIVKAQTAVTELANVTKVQSAAGNAPNAELSDEAKQDLLNYDPRAAVWQAIDAESADSRD